MSVRTILRNSINFWLLVCIVFGFAFAQNATAQTGFVVEQIVVEGTERIEPVTVISYLTFRTGDRATQADLDDSLTALFRTGLFRDVVLERQNTIVLIQIVENPVINRIAFEGNRSLDDEQLEVEIELRPREQRRGGALGRPHRRLDRVLQHDADRDGRDEDRDRRPAPQGKVGNEREQ